MAVRSHISPLGYAITFGVLVVLSGLTLGASFFTLGIWSVVIALVIAGIKAVLVALFFMHLIEQRTSNRLVAGVGVAFVGLLVVLMVIDVDTRPALLGDMQLRPEPVPEPAAAPESAAEPPR